MILRINKFLSRAGICSRRDSDYLIKSNKVNVNGKIATIGMNIDTSKDEVSVNEKIIKINSFDRKIWIYHKPTGVVTTHRDEKNRTCISHILKSKFDSQHLVTVGRLDLNSEGLLLITNDGMWAQDMMKSSIKRVYKVRSFGEINILKMNNMKKKLKKGIKIKNINYAPIELSIKLPINDKDILKSQNFWSEVVLFEGKNREIRKIFQHFGLKVNRLIRISYGDFHLENLEKGEIQEVLTTK